jgi:hypothetical protein
MRKGCWHREERRFQRAEEIGLLAAEGRRLLTEIHVTLMTTKEVADSRAEKVAVSSATWWLTVKQKSEESWQEGQMRLLKAEDSR